MRSAADSCYASAMTGFDPLAVTLRARLYRRLLYSWPAEMLARVGLAITSRRSDMIWAEVLNVSVAEARSMRG